jgi:aspartate aminotransferase
MSFAARVNSITPSATMAVKRAAEELKRRGVDVIDLGPGEPDFSTPEHIKEAARQALAQNFTKYTADSGIIELRETIAYRYNQNYKTDYTAENILVTSGAKQALYHISEALFETGDEVLLPVPYWVSYPEQIKLMGATPVLIQTHAHEGFRLRAETVAAQITQHTKAIIVNSPNNPSGAIIERSELKKIVELAVKHRLWLIYDECYEKFLYEGAHVSAAEFDTQHVITVSSVSKTYAMTGWRLGWAVAPKELIQAMAKLQSHSTSHPTSISQHAALAALIGDQSCVSAMLSEYRRRRGFLLGELAQMKGLKYSAPPGAFYLFPDVSRFFNREIHNSSELARYLLERAQVAVVPGTGFGVEECIRISYATSGEQLREGLKRLREGLQNLC